MPSLSHRPHLIFPALLLLASACVAPKTVHAPPPPIPVPIVATPAPPPATADWRDIPLTPGDWRYGPRGQGTAARFGRAGAPADFTARCDRTTRTIILSRTAAARPCRRRWPSPLPPATARSPRRRSPGRLRAYATTLPAGDGFLDKMAFSRGRFVIAVTGTPRLVIPSWPEFARVIEDCRG